MNTRSEDIAWPAPAKLNLFLHIIGRRADGYHLLQTVFQFLNRCDTLYFTVRAHSAIRRESDLPSVAEEEDLTVRAARLLKQTAGTTQGVDIRITKRLPLGAGLGGGSSNAATTLIALNYLWGLRLPKRKLAELGERLGADVPVFIHGEAAWAEGIGEQLIPISLEEPWYLVVVPSCQISTGEIFSALDLTRHSTPITMYEFHIGHIRNDCESVVVERYPEVGEALEWLNRFAKARLTGTGACVFAPFSSKERAQVVLNRLPDRWQGFIAKGINQSPLARFVKHLPPWPRS
jgi:4-diphosphocytidyl-2C-methyl-D-erythritol kinase